MEPTNLSSFIVIGGAQATAGLSTLLMEDPTLER